MLLKWDVTTTNYCAFQVKLAAKRSPYGQLAATLAFIKPQAKNARRVRLPARWLVARLPPVRPALSPTNLESQNRTRRWLVVCKAFSGRNQPKFRV